MKFYDNYRRNEKNPWLMHEASLFCRQLKFWYARVKYCSTRRCANTGLQVYCNVNIRIYNHFNGWKVVLLIWLCFNIIFIQWLVFRVLSDKLSDKTISCQFVIRINTNVLCGRINNKIFLQKGTGYAIFGFWIK